MNTKQYLFSFISIIFLCSACESIDDSNSQLKLDEMHQILNLSDGSCIVAGVYGSSIRLIRTNASFEPLWQKENYPWGINLKEMTWGSTGYLAHVTHLFARENGNFIAVISTIAGSCVVYSETVISEINSLGNEVRSIQLEGGGFNPFLVVQCPDGGFLLKGHEKFIKLNSMLEQQWERDTNEDMFNIYVLKAIDGNQFATTGSTDSYGIFLKILDENAHDISSAIFSETQGFSEEAGYDVMQLNENGYLIAGRSRHYNGNFNMDGYLIRTKNTGDTIWTRRFGDESEQYFEKILYFDDEVIVAQGHQGFPGEQDVKMFFLKLSLEGEFIDTSYWNIGTSFYQKQDDVFLKISNTEDGNLEITEAGIEEIFNQ